MISAASKRATDPGSVLAGGGAFADFGPVDGQAHGPVLGASMTRALVPLDRFRGSDWLRVTVVDGAGNRAWSKPVRVTATVSQNFLENVTQG